MSATTGCIEMRRHYVVSGRVQGVGFRQFTAEKARALKISGWVKNRPDGNVEAEAEGSEDELQAFEKNLRAGPALSRVDEVKMQSFEADAALPTPFEVRR